MKNEEQSFDELIRGKLENRSFTPNASSWQKAEQLMKAKHAAKTGFSGLAVAASTIVVAGSIFALSYFGGKKEKLAAENPKAKTVQAVAANNFSENPVGENAPQPENNSSSKQENKNANPQNVPVNPDVHSTSASQEKIPGKENTAENNPSETNKEKAATQANAGTSHPAKTTTKNKPGKSTPGNSGDNSFVKANSAQEKNPGQIKPENPPAKNSGTASSTAKDPANPSSTAKNSSDNSSAAKNNSAENAGPEKTAVSGKENAAGTPNTTGSEQTGNPGTENANAGIAANEPGNPSAEQKISDSTFIPLSQDANTNAQTAGTHVHPATQLADSLLSANHPQASSTEKNNPASTAGTDPAAANPQTAADKTSSTTLSATQTAQEQNTAQKQNSNTLPAKTDSVKMNTLPPPSRRNGGTSYVFAQAGMGFMPAFSNNDHSGRSLNPVLGGGFGFRLKGMWEMQLGLRYTFTGHASDSSHTYVTTTYTFGAQEHYTEIRLVRMHYLAAPLNVRWHVGPNIFLAGASANYLFTSESRRSTYDETNGSISNKRNISIFGYSQGLNRFDVQLSAGYGRSFGRSWSAEFSAYYGLFDVKNNAFYGVSKFERNKGLQLLVQYSF